MSHSSTATTVQGDFTLNLIGQTTGRVFCTLFACEWLCSFFGEQVAQRCFWTFLRSQGSRSGSAWWNNLTTHCITLYHVSAVLNDAWSIWKQYTVRAKHKLEYPQQNWSFRKLWHPLNGIWNTTEYHCPWAARRVTCSCWLRSDPLEKRNMSVQQKCYLTLHLGR